MDAEDTIYNKLVSLLRESLDTLVSRQSRLEPVRDDLIVISRKIYEKVRLGFRLAYKGEYSCLGELLHEIRDLVHETNRKLKAFNEEVLDRVVFDSLREYVELILLYTLVTGNTTFLNSLKELEPEIIVDGYIDFVGEVQRLIQDSLLKSECGEAFRYIELLEKIYVEFFTSQLSNFIYKDHKRKSDRVRSILERVKSDYIFRCGEK